MRETPPPTDLIVSRLKDWSKRNEIKVAIFDLDDTLLDTNGLFEQKEGKFFDFVGQRLPGLDRNQLVKDYNRLNHEAFQAVYVNPVKFHRVIGGLGDLYGPEAAGVFQEGLPILEEVYRTVPPFHPGARETLEIFKSAGIPLGLLTHANLTWTNLKVRQLGLRDYFSHIWTADEDGLKGKEDWKIIIFFFGVKPEEVLIIGDNIKGDILPAHELGVKHKIYIPSPWSFYQEGTVPEGTITVDRIGKLIETAIN